MLTLHYTVPLQRVTICYILYVLCINYSRVETSPTKCEDAQLWETL